MSSKTTRKKSAAHKREDHPFKIFRLPPEGFDARKASARELRLHGVPKRPDAETHPKLQLLWDQIAQRRPRFVEPAFLPGEKFHRSKLRDHRSLFDITPVKLHPYLDSWLKRFIDSGISLWLPETSTNWCGAYVNKPATETLRVVAGQWTVPSVSPPPSAWNGTKYADGQYICAVWVGLDGTKGTNDVLQAGTLSQVTVSGGVVTGTTYSVWTEWFGSPWIVQSLGVSPGDQVSCTVCSPFENTHGTAMFTNLTTNESVNYGIDAPAGTTLSGNVAEWITEDPGQLGGGLFPFPNFGQVQFTHCTAGSKTVELDLLTSTLIDLVDAAKSVRAESLYQNRRSVRCQFVK
jgi:peptidase A4-like protein